MCSEEHRVVECPTFSSCTIEQKVQHAKDQRLCFSCLNRGHVTKECKSRVKCDANGCSRFHHRLLHQDPKPPPTPRVSSASSALDKESIMPVVRVQFKSTNGRVREGNVLIDSGAGTTVIRKDFAGLSAYKDIENESTLRSLAAKKLPKKTVNESNFGYLHFMVKSLIPSKPTN